MCGILHQSIFITSFATHPARVTSHPFPLCSAADEYGAYVRGQVVAGQRVRMLVDSDQLSVGDYGYYVAQEGSQGRFNWECTYISPLFGVSCVAHILVAIAAYAGVLAVPWEHVELIGSTLCLLLALIIPPSLLPAQTPKLQPPTLPRPRLRLRPNPRPPQPRKHLHPIRVDCTHHCSCLRQRLRFTH